MKLYFNIPDVEPGDYDITVTDTDYFVSVVFTVTGSGKETPVLSIDNSTVTYNGSSQEAIVSGSVPGSASDVKYDGYLTAPTDAGTYEVTADFEPDDPSSYNSLDDAFAGYFTIDKADVDISVTPYHVTYDASEHTAAGTATGVLGGGSERVS